MDISIKMTKDFETTLNHIKNKYGEDFEFLNGFHSSQMDFSEFINGFIDKNVADVTIDANANASNKDIRSLISEKGKSMDKLFAFHKIFYELKKKYGIKVAREWLEGEYNGEFYLHDAPSSTFFSYCYAYDLTRLAKEGLFFLNNYNYQPPKHLTTFIDDVIEYISYFSNRSSGAVGIPNILIWTYYFWKKDCETNYVINNPDYYIRQSFQKIIYRLNQPFMRIDQSAFVNVSIFDRNYIEALFGGMEYPDGTYVIDFIEELIEHQKIFMEVVSEIRSENMFTFPVLTYSLLYKNNKFEDEDFARWCSDHNTKWNDSNFFVSGDVTTLSNCPVGGDTKILYWSEYYKQFKLSPIKDVFFRKSTNDTIKVLSNGKVIECKINQFNDKAEYLITLTNGATLRTTKNHLNKVLGKEYIRTEDLTTEDYLPYSMQEYTSNDCLTFEDGKLVGLFLGDGSYRNESEITFSLNSETDKDEIEWLKNYCSKHFGAKFNFYECTSRLTGNKKCLNIHVNSSYLKGLIKQFTIGDTALNKELNLNVLNCSIDFRKGIIAGMYASDGNKTSENCNRIYTSSEKLKDTLIVLFSSLGLVTKVYVDDRKNRLSENVCYTIRWFTPNGKTKRKDSYVIENGYMWIKIKSIEKVPNAQHGSYCLEVVSNNEPVFMLGNGIVTHNCRLLSNTSKLDAFINSIGGTALSIGSIKVNTINLMRIALETNNETDYLKLLLKRTKLCCQTLDVIRHIIQRNIEKGLLPNYKDGGVEIAKQYSTIGILGLFEVIEHFGYTNTDEFGYTYYTEEGIAFASKIFEVLNQVKDTFTVDYSFNIESVPAERAAIILCQKDNLLYDLHDKFIYSNQWIPLSTKCTVQEKLRLSSILDTKCSGGSIAHINLESNFPNTDTAWEMLNTIAKAGVIYFAFNTKINECKNHHGFVGSNICPTCGEPVFDTYQRIVGYLVPTRSYSSDRFKEFNTRKWYEYAELLSE